MERSSNELSEVSWQLELLRRWTALLAIVLIAVTWRLWWGGSEFPAIPLGAWLSHVPWIADRASCCTLLLGLTLVLFGNARHGQWGWSLVLVAGGTLAMLDQHRWQPWFYQLLLYAAVFRLSSPSRTAQLLVWLTASIYLFSALGKFDAQFLHTVGQQLWLELTQFISMAQRTEEPWEPRPVAFIALLPAAEILLTAGLAWRTTRRWAGVLAISFHVALMVLLGPLGLDHSAGVVLWNLQFAGQALCLFVLVDWSRTPPRPVPKTPRTQPTWRDHLATAIVGLAILLPVGERWGHWDHWLSWALYAPHSSRTEMWIASTATHKLPESLQQTIVAEQTDRAERQRKYAKSSNPAHRDSPAAEQHPALWLRVPIERWSLEQTGTPIYPQARFQLGVARALAERIDSEFKVRIVLRGVAARWDGHRQSQEINDASQLNAAARNFWIGTTPRRLKTAG